MKVTPIAIARSIARDSPKEGSRYRLHHDKTGHPWTL
jgi:hypothetical protein